MIRRHQRAGVLQSLLLELIRMAQGAREDQHRLQPSRAVSMPTGCCLLTGDASN